MNFKVGQKVVCIRDNWHKLCDSPGKLPSLPVKDKIYVINEIEVNVITFLGFVEFPDGFFDSKDFRPLDYQFAEDVLAEIAEQIEEEELVAL